MKITPNGIGRCGLFDEDWRKDVVDLKPGESIKINDWLENVGRLLMSRRTVGATDSRQI